MVRRVGDAEAVSDVSSSGHPVVARIALFGAAWAGVSAFGVVAHAAATLVLGAPAEFLQLPFAVHFGTCVIPLVMWALCREPRSRRFARVVEAVGLVTSAAAIAVMGQALAYANTPNMPEVPALFYAQFAETTYESFSRIVVFAASMMFTVRSALVPSRTMHTALLGIAMGAAIVVVLVLGYHPPPGSEGAPRLNLAVSLISSWLVPVAVCAVLSAIIYGLHQEIEKARKLGQYTLEEKIGEGGMGIVYRARHAMLRRPTAIKLLPRDRVGDEAIKRFEREVQRTAELTHPNTVTVYDYGRTPDGVFYYAMELLDGATTQTIVDASGPQPASRVVHVLRMVASALVEAHGRGLIHRDIKPANITLSERGGMLDVATILDFGLVRELESGEDQELTFEGKIVGTPLYLAPEVIRAANSADARSDIYALAAVGYFMLTGHTVFGGKSIVEVCSHHLHSPVIRPSDRLRGPVPADLEALIVQCLAKEPDDRPASAVALLDAFDALDVPKWSQQDARAWWDEHGERVRQLDARRIVDPGSVSATLLRATPTV